MQRRSGKVMILFVSALNTMHVAVLRVKIFLLYAPRGLSILLFPSY